MAIPPMKSSFGKASQDAPHNQWGELLTEREKMWQKFSHEPNSLGKLAATPLGFIGEMLFSMACIASSTGDVDHAVRFGYSLGAADHNARFDAVRVQNPMQYAQSDAAFTNQFKAMGMSA